MPMVFKKYNPSYTYSVEQNVLVIYLNTCMDSMSMISETFSTWNTGILKFTYIRHRRPD